MTKVEYIAVSHSFLQLLTGMTGQMYCLEYFLTILDPLSATICKEDFRKKQVMLKIAHITMQRLA